PVISARTTPVRGLVWMVVGQRSEEHTSELQSRRDLVCRLLLEKKKNRRIEFPADVPEPHGLSPRVGCERGGHGLIRLRFAILSITQAVPRSAHRLASTGSAKAGLDDQRDPQSA